MNKRCKHDIRLYWKCCKCGEEILHIEKSRECGTEIYTKRIDKDCKERGIPADR